MDDITVYDCICVIFQFKTGVKLERDVWNPYYIIIFGG
jgi:hypothetical protein